MRRLPCRTGPFADCTRPEIANAPAPARRSIGAAASRRIEQFAIVESPPRTVRRQNDRGRHHRPEQRASADLVDARYGLKAARAQFSFQRRFATEFATRGFGSHEEMAYDVSRARGD